MLLPKKQEELSVRLDSLIAVLSVAKRRVEEKLAKSLNDREQLQEVRGKIDNALFVCDLVRISLRKYASPITEKDILENNIEQLCKRLSQL